MTVLIAIMTGSAPITQATAATPTRLPVGVKSPIEPSGYAPPNSASLPGYVLTYRQDFIGTSLPPGWDLFSGIPGGDPTGRFSPQHVRVSQGLLQLSVYRDPSYANHWVTGGLCQCGRPTTYGAYFVRSRVTAPGPNSVELLWPASNAWPPEIDFSEDLFHVNLVTTTTHWTNHLNFHILKINMLQWHTWGVIWTPSYILYVVDGRPWHEVSLPGASPNIPMVLDFEQRTTCPSTTRCPSVPSKMLIDWVAEYRPTK